MVTPAEYVELSISANTLLMITASATFGLMICGLVMQAYNYVRICRMERKIQKTIEDFRNEYDKHHGGISPD